MVSLSVERASIGGRLGVVREKRRLEGSRLSGKAELHCPLPCSRLFMKAGTAHKIVLEIRDPEARYEPRG